MPSRPPPCPFGGARAHVICSGLLGAAAVSRRLRRQTVPVAPFHRLAYASELPAIHRIGPHRTERTLLEIGIHTGLDRLKAPDDFRVRNLAKSRHLYAVHDCRLIEHVEWSQIEHSAISVGISVFV